MVDNEEIISKLQVENLNYTKLINSPRTLRKQLILDENF